MYNNRHRFQIRPGRKRSITTCLSNHPSTTITRPPVHPSRSSGTSRSISFSVVFRLDLARFVRVPGERVDRIHEEKTALVTGLVRRFEESLLPEPLSSGVARSFVGTRSGVARRTASGVGRAARRAVGRMGRVRRGGGGQVGEEHGETRGRGERRDENDGGDGAAEKGVADCVAHAGGERKGEVERCTGWLADVIVARCRRFREV